MDSIGCESPDKWDCGAIYFWSHLETELDTLAYPESEDGFSGLSKRIQSG